MHSPRQEFQWNCALIALTTRLGNAFLALKSMADEFSDADLEERLAEQELKSGEGLWLNPSTASP